jgi:hypothetical protein
MSMQNVATEVLKRLADKGVLALPSADGDSRAHAEAALQELSRRRPQEVLDAFVADIAAGMVPTIAGSLPELGRPGAIRVRQTIDWRINAAVSKAPPYEAVVTTNLVQFVSSMLNTLQSGIGIQLVADDGQAQGRSIEARPVRLVARDVKRLLDGFLAEQDVATLDADATGARYMIQFRLFHCALAWALGHELGHIVVTESRRRRQEAPFQPLATHWLESHFTQLLGDRRFRDALGQPDEAQQLRIFDHWLTEINADILGASLACGYEKERGPSRGIPGVVGFTMLAIHLGLMSQYLLAAYMNLLNPRLALASPTHPPMDFRMHCVLLWMYRDRMREATEAPVAYVQQVFTEVLRQAGAKVDGPGAGS